MVGKGTTDCGTTGTIGMAGASATGAAGIGIALTVGVVKKSGTCDVGGDVLKIVPVPKPTVGLISAQLFGLRTCGDCGAYAKAPVCCGCVRDLAGRWAPGTIC
mmetsp:Transcript_45599/g.85115  ORF Transcript_45599/g.85115 Transcript_45599/m.85115 type:complete len:103 (-) Transcript_45599:128-436(-)